MKYLIAPFCFLLMLSCSPEDNKKSTPNTESTSQSEIGSPPKDVPQVNDQPKITTNTTKAHFVCPKGCVGGTGDAEAPCPICGTTMAHNQAFHDQPQVDPNTQQQQEPPQNAKGVWHFTCPKGCAGGAGSAATCADCGATLTHNPVYHES